MWRDADHGCRVVQQTEYEGWLVDWSDFRTATAYAMHRLRGLLELSSAQRSVDTSHSLLDIILQTFPSTVYLANYPYLLLNLVAVEFNQVAITRGFFPLKEMNPKFQSRPRHQGEC